MSVAVAPSLDEPSRNVYRHKYGETELTLEHDILPLRRTRSKPEHKHDFPTGGCDRRGGDALRVFLGHRVKRLHDAVAGRGLDLCDDIRGTVVEDGRCTKGLDECEVTWGARCNDLIACKYRKLDRALSDSRCDRSMPNTRTKR